jgi:hypothetical protein
MWNALKQGGEIPMPQTVANIEKEVPTITAPMTATATS